MQLQVNFVDLVVRAANGVSAEDDKLRNDLPRMGTYICTSRDTLYIHHKYSSPLNPKPGRLSPAKQYSNRRHNFVKCSGQRRGNHEQCCRPPTRSPFLLASPTSLIR
jgi:hypothetical protein